jgi:hypothetical protein
MLARISFDARGSAGQALEFREHKDEAASPPKSQ